MPESMIHEALLKERVRHLKQISPALAAGNAAIATFLMIPIWSSDAFTATPNWYAAALVYSAFLMTTWLVIKRAGWRFTMRRSAKLSSITMGTVGGILWGSTGFVMVIPGDLIQQTMILVCQGIVAISVAANLSLLPRLCYPFLASSTILLISGLVNMNDSSHFAIAGMALLFSLAIAGSAYVGNKRFERGVKSQFIAGEASAYLADAINSSDRAYAVYSPEGIPVVANDMFTELFGPPKPISEATDTISKTEETADGRWLSSTWRKTRHGGWAFLCEDVTKLKNRERDLVNARDLAENANRAKTEFLALMSHELRTPLNVIIGFSDVIRLGMLDLDDDEKIKEYATHIAGSGSHLLKLINDILDLSKIDAGKYEMVEQIISLHALCKGICVLLSQEAEKRNVDLINEVEDDTISLLADDRMINQMLMNLLSNAIKFSKPGGQVRLTCRQSKDEFVFEIIDQGIGIAPEDLEKVFEPFYQVESQLNRSIEGTGLGVSIVKRLVEHHGGRMTLDSIVGQGTTARLHFSLERLRKDEPLSAETPPARSAHL